jgi:hypothetical protein
MGWTYDDVQDLPVDVYAELVTALNEEAEKAKR